LLDEGELGVHGLAVGAGAGGDPATVDVGGDEGQREEGEEEESHRGYAIAGEEEVIVKKG